MLEGHLFGQLVISKKKKKKTDKKGKKRGNAGMNYFQKNPLLHTDGKKKQSLYRILG